MILFLDDPYSNFLQLLILLSIDLQTIFFLLLHHSSNTMLEKKGRQIFFMLIITCDILMFFFLSEFIKQLPKT